jgi:hypothetical protein
MASKLNAVGCCGFWGSREGRGGEGKARLLWSYFSISNNTDSECSATRKVVLVDETWRQTDGFETIAEMESGHVTCVFPNVASAKLYQQFKSIDSSNSFLAGNKYQTDHPVFSPTETTGTDGISCSVRRTVGM